MKTRNYEVEDHGTHLQVSFNGFNVQDVFINSFGSFKKMVWQKNINRPEPKIPGLPVLSHSIHVTGDTPEAMFGEWFTQLLHHTDSMHYLPISLDLLYLQDNLLKAKVTYRQACIKDKCTFAAKGIDRNSIKFEKTKSGLKLRAKIDL